jgi:hypothetical protein
MSDCPNEKWFGATTKYKMTYWCVVYSQRREVTFFTMKAALKVMEFRLERPHLFTELTLNAV